MFLKLQEEAHDKSWGDFFPWPLSLTSSCTVHDKPPERAGQLLSVPVSSAESIHRCTDDREAAGTSCRGESPTVAFPQQPQDSWWSRPVCWPRYKWVCAGSVLTRKAAQGEQAHWVASWHGTRGTTCQPAGSGKARTLTQSHCTAQWSLLHGYLPTWTSLVTKLLWFINPWLAKYSVLPCHKEKKMSNPQIPLGKSQLSSWFCMGLVLMTNITPDSQQNKVSFSAAHQGLKGASRLTFLLVHDN